jgi:hypothetical protein
MRSLIEHYEQYLGTVRHGWSRSPDGAEMPFQVVECRGGVLPGVAAFTTVGISRYELKSSVSAKVIRQELLLAAPVSFGARNIPGLLQQIGGEAINRGLAYLRGEVIGPRGRLFEKKDFKPSMSRSPYIFPKP